MQIEGFLALQAADKGGLAEKWWFQFLSVLILGAFIGAPLLAMGVKPIAGGTTKNGQSRMCNSGNKFGGKREIYQ